MSPEPRSRIKNPNMTRHTCPQKYMSPDSRNAHNKNKHPRGLLRRMSLGIGAILVPVAIAAGLWFLAATGASNALQTWIDEERAAGRTWECPDKSISGFPFRIELRCNSPSLALQGPGAFTGAIGAIAASMTLYAPHKIKATLATPMVAETGTPAVSLSAAWVAANFAFNTEDSEREILTAAFDHPSIRLRTPDFPERTVELGSLTTAVERLRAEPGLSGAHKVLVRVEKMRSRDLDMITGNDAAASIELDAHISNFSSVAASGTAATLEVWRLSGGVVEIVSAVFRKDSLAVQASGTVGLDDAHRIRGSMDVETESMEAILQLLGLPISASDTITLLQRLAAPRGENRSPNKIRVSLRMEGGLVFVGPLPTGLRLFPLY